MPPSTELICSQQDCCCIARLPAAHVIEIAFYSYGSSWRIHYRALIFVFDQFLAQYNETILRRITPQQALRAKMHCAVLLYLRANASVRLFCLRPFSIIIGRQLGTAYSTVFTCMREEALCPFPNSTTVTKPPSPINNHDRVLLGGSLGAAYPAYPRVCLDTDTN